MHLNQLWVFYQVAKHKSFSQAAEALFLSQPSVSNKIKLLEKTCGLKFFDRSGRSVELTNTGEILLS
jgi:DNA-binding transcriptional LysR family regulator